METIMKTYTVEEAMEGIDELDPDEAEDVTDLAVIGHALDSIEHAKAELLATIADARAHGRSWTEIAHRLGVSRQAARERWSDAVAALPATPKALAS